MPRRGRSHRVLLIGSGVVLAAVLALVPLLAAATTRPDDRTVLDAYLVALGAVIAISVGAAVFLGWEIARHRRHRSPMMRDHGDPSLSA